MNKRKEKYPDWPDSELLSLYKKTKDKDVVTELFFRYTNLVSGICLKYFKDREQVRDAVSTIYEELLSKALVYEVKEFRNWLYTITKNYCISFLKKNDTVFLQLADEGPVDIADYSGIDRALEKEKQYELLEKCLGILSAEQASVIKLFYLESKCYNEISSVTGYEWNKVRSLIQNGKRNLKNCMEAV